MITEDALVKYVLTSNTYRLAYILLYGATSYKIAQVLAD